ncbi:MAG: hydroxymethylpyrimidine/phosphomethylpyrimidine kinase, partial [Aestuariivirgaceae bacterium]
MTDRPAVLVIAGTDSSGGAGLARDLATLADHDVAAMTAITAITAQTDDAVTAVHHVPATIISAQLASAINRHDLAAIKIGMLGTAQAVEAVVSALSARPDVPVVLDPVLQATSGARLLDHEGIDLLRKRLLPLCRLATPNLPEAATLSECVMPTPVQQQAEAILACGAGGVLIKGGHARGEDAVDVLFEAGLPALAITEKRLDVAMRGTGCTLASAIAGHLARGA